ncbi:MAG: choice-of-anchor Q domain-containing protein [Chitinophagaceae bacterium]
MRLLVVTILIVACSITACKKDSFITSSSASLNLSEDSLHFDTVFTTTGSVTQYFIIYNTNNQRLRLSNVTLAGGSTSYFKINVDGTPGPSVQDVEIDANDSVYVFLSVKIDPTSANLPFIIEDSIKIDYNGNTRKVKLSAWGQNANFIHSGLVQGSQTWTNTKPYVILGSLQVDTNATLTIQKGTRIYLHADAPFIVDGTLQVNGEQYDSTRVVFQGDRLDDPYRDYPASWPGIYFRGQSKNNVLHYAIVKNAYQGIVVDQPSINANKKVSLNECIIDNCYDVGIYGLRTSIHAQNTLVSNCGKNVVLAYGGNYDFAQSTIATYSSSYITHKEPVLFVADYVKQDNVYYTDNLTASFVNCIFWGDNSTVENEVVTGKQGNTSFAVNFQNCLWRVKTNPANSTYTNIIANESPEFDSIDVQRHYYDFRLKASSPALQQGTATTLTTDLDGNPRPATKPDLGCYQRQ